MPRYGRKKTITRRFKKAARRRTTRKNTAGRITQWPARRQRPIRSWPDSIRVKLCYSVVLSLGGNISIYNIFRGNSIYDPEYAAGGGTPQGYTQWAALYSKYKVNGSSIRVQPVVANATNLAAACSWSVAPVLSAASHYAETLSMFPYAKSRIQQNVYTGARGVSSYMSTRKICGQSTSDSDFESATGTNPSKEWYWNLAFTAIDGATSLDFYALVTLTYYATFSNRLTPV